MININLLPPEYGPKKLITLGNLVMIFICFLICLSLLLSSFKLLATVQDYSSRLDYHNDQIKHYKLQVEDVRILNQKVKMLKSRLSLLEELLQEQITWSDKLVDLAECLPQYGTWIDSLNIERQEPEARPVAKAAAKSQNIPEKKRPEPIVVYITGSAVSVDKVSQFVANLEESRTFSNIVFDSASTNVARAAITDDDSLVTFKLAVEITSSGQEF